MAIKVKSRRGIEFIICDRCKHWRLRHVPNCRCDCGCADRETPMCGHQNKW